MSWKEMAEREQSPKLPAGQHQVTVKKLVTGPKDGEPFTSSKGDPQIMLVVEDDAGREAAQMFTLSDKAGWVLARFMSAAGVNMDELDQQGIGVADFADSDFATPRLVGLQLTVDVAWERAANGKDYSDLTPVKLEHKAASPAKSQPPRQLAGAGAGGKPKPQPRHGDAHQPVDESEIPF